MFNGSSKQAVTFNNQGLIASRFSHVQIANPDTVEFNTSVYITGQLEMVDEGLLTGYEAFCSSKLPITNGTYFLDNCRMWV